MLTLAKLREQHTIAERRLVRSALVLNRWNCRQAAIQLGISPATMILTLRRLGLQDEYQQKNGGPGRPKGADNA